MDFRKFDFEAGESTGAFCRHCPSTSDGRADPKRFAVPSFFCVYMAYEYDTPICREAIKQNTASPSRRGCVSCGIYNEY